MLSANQMIMQVINTLPAPWTTIIDQAIAILGNVFLLGQASRQQLNLTQCIHILISGFIQGSEVYPWDYQQVDRSRRINVPYHHEFSIFVDNRSGDFLAYYFAE